MVIRVFVASSSGSVAIKKRQQDVVRFLEANRIEFEEVDITMSEEKRQWMYKNIPEDRQPAQGNPLPPQIFSDDRYCGDYDGFFESKESNTVFSFLGLKPTLASKLSIVGKSCCNTISTPWCGIPISIKDHLITSEESTPALGKQSHAFMDIQMDGSPVHSDTLWYQGAMFQFTHGKTGNQLFQKLEVMDLHLGLL
ncbi:hypothetical protein HGM15179_002423 [Zosterops borbonicus]|uniref:SH3 domain-binding glutamic acid-rich-like protein n=1 Tax=Zosterops borbonicus TaxID=364589 RepID=A0A8K1LSV5_9PASS|nr:hypothetical protein HGM15179_002423 [Zosterops borbonicus]